MLRELAMTRKLLSKAVFLPILLLLAGAGLFSASAQQLRPLTPDDTFRLQQLGGASFAGQPGTFSPDGKWFAYVLRRPKTEVTDYGQDSQEAIWEADRADVWIVSTSGGDPVNLTKGNEERCGYWSPSWSPDSSRLAVVSNKGNALRLWIVDRSTGKKRLLIDREVAFHHPSQELTNPVWTGPTTLACAVLAAGEKPLGLELKARVAEVAPMEWKKSFAGKEPTDSVLESGVSPGYRFRPKGSLILVDISNGSTRELGGGNFDEVSISPDHRYLAAAEMIDITPPGGQAPMTSYYQKYRVSLYALNGGKSAKPFMFAENLVGGSIRWSPDSTRIAALARYEGKNASPWVYRIGDSDAHPASGDSLVIPAQYMGARGILWSGRNELIVHAQKRGEDTPGSSRMDWWYAAETGAPRNLTASFKTPPAQLYAAKDPGGFAGLVDSKLWRIFIDKEPVQINTGQDVKIASISWPAAGSETHLWDHLIAASKEGQETALYKINLADGKAELVSKPVSDAELNAYDPSADLTAFHADNRNGLFVWIQAAGSPPRKILEANTFLKEIGEGEARTIEYTSLDGQKLKAQLVLPWNYKPGTRYPMITWVYAGSMAGEAPYILAKLGVAHEFNLQLLPAHGYALLIPSMPLKPEGVASDPYAELTKGVIPAIDKAIELGFADPQRLGLMGHSYGGYSTYGLITQTNRFKAAIALAGVSDLVSLYGIFDARQRYDNFVQEGFFAGRLSESGQTRMGSPPWKDTARYIRNSPVFWADRVETPLMIVQGDMDYVALEQGEEFFSALYRQGKRAKFVRYWGEAHILSSPANIRDLWQKIYDWFDQYLSAGPAKNPEAMSQGSGR